MSENQEDVLANFQSITGIDDVAEAIFYLEQSNWNLLDAVNRVLPQDHVEQQSYETETLNNLNITGNSASEDNIPGSPSALLHRNIFGAEQSTSLDAGNSNLNEHVARNGVESGYNGVHNGEVCASGSKAKDVTFNVHHNYVTHNVVVSEDATVGDLKRKICEVTSIPICRQSFRGWGNASDLYNNTTKLSAMNVAQQNELIVSDINEDGEALDDEGVNRLNSTFTLNILNEKDNSPLQLKFLGTHTVLDIKKDVYSVTNIAVRHQEWIGWPNSVTDNTVLALTGIPLEHDFILRSIETANSSRSNSATTRNHGSTNETIDIDSDSSIDEFEDASDFNADEELFTATVSNKRPKNLIPDGTDNERQGCLQFIDNYNERYGPPHPPFFAGTLEEALNEACHKPAKDRKLLAIYLHHDGSVLTNVFCDRLMKCDTIMQTLEHNFILYGWDLTHESNKNLFLSSISACAGSTALITVRNTPTLRLPAILVIGKSRSVCEVLSVIYGNVGVDELLNKLMDTIKLYSDQRDIEVREEDERAARELVKMEQDAAYNESLEADKRKEEVKKQKEQAIATERKRLESERQEIEAIREMNRLEAEKCVPPEPEPNTEGITKIRIRKPTGEFMERRFLAKSKLDTLLKFIASKGFPIDEYKVISSWPRRDLTSLNVNDTMQDLNLCPQETVILEER